MTMPHLMNCPHSDDSHCLDCVKESHDRFTTEIERLRAENAKFLQPGGYEYFVKSRDDAESRAMRYQNIAEHAVEQLNKANAELTRLRTLYAAAWAECEDMRDRYPIDPSTNPGIIEARATTDAARKENNG